MLGSKDICSKIVSIFPDIGDCGKEIEVKFDEKADAWEVDLRKEGRFLKTFVDKSEAEACLIGGKCIQMGLQVAQLKDNIKLM